MVVFKEQSQLRLIPAKKKKRKILLFVLRIFLASFSSLLIAAAH